jgi:hypothetical protein
LANGPTKSEKSENSEISEFSDYSDFSDFSDYSDSPQNKKDMNSFFNKRRISLAALALVAIAASADTKYVGCTKLQEIVLPPTLTSIGDGALRGCTALTKVTSFNATAPTCGTDVFADAVNTYRTAGTVLYAGSAAYASADTWYRFGDIRVTGKTNVNASPSAGKNNIDITATAASVTLPATGITPGLTYSLTFGNATGALTLDGATGSLKSISAGTTTSGTSFTSLTAGLYLLTVGDTTIRIIIYTK